MEEAGGASGEGEGRGVRDEDESEGKGAGARWGTTTTRFRGLTAALSSLQSDMQRLSQQQKVLMRRKTTPATPAWVIPAGPKKSPAPAVAGSAPSPRISRESATPSSPSPSRRAHATATSPKSPKSPQTSQHRRAQSVPPKSPKHHSRPLDLKFPPLARVLTPPQNVDTLPHLRRVSPSQCQVQTASSFTIGALRSPPPPPPTPPPPLPRPAEDSSSETGSSEDPAIFTLELDSAGPLPRRGPWPGGTPGGAAVREPPPSARTTATPGR